MANALRGAATSQAASSSRVSSSVTYSLVRGQRSSEGRRSVTTLPRGDRGRLSGVSRRFPARPPAQGCSVHRRLGPPLHAELGEQAGDIVLHGLLRQEQPLPNLPVGASVSDQIENFTLPRGQAAGHRISLNGIPEPIEQLLSHRRIQQRPPRRDLPNALHQTVATDLLEQITRRAGHHRSKQRLIVIV